MAEERIEIVGQYLSSGRLLDVGCGAGFFLEAARQRGWNCSGCEFSPDLADYVRKQLQIEVLDGPFEDLPFTTESYDAVTMWDVLEHTRDPRVALSKAWEILRPGGLIFLITPNIDGLYPRVTYWPGRLVSYWPHPTPPAHTFQFSKATLRRLLEGTGFQVVANRDRRIRMSYSLNLEGRPFSLKRWAYAALFSPLAWLGPLLGAGDEVLMVAARERAAQ
jgi:2-polyprenyl-3-methyl-5-hydroxy-6-metoxy-1,4-benzoquinol methylase